MNMITVKAKTLDEAITKALIELGTTSDNLDYTIKEEGRAGIFGLFGKDVVITAKKKKEDDDLEAFLATGKIDSSSLEPTVKEKKKDTPKKNPQKNQQKSQQKNQQKAQKEEAAAETKQPVPKPPKKQTPKPAAEPLKESVKEVVKESEVKEDSDEKKPARKIDVEACDRAAKEFLNQVFGAMGMEVTVNTSFDEKEKEMTVDLSGDDMGILIGKRGQTLDSLQYLISLVVNKKCEGYVRVKLDTENYRVRRKETLETLAKNIAYKVKRTRRSVSLEPMNPYERRIIHAALQSDRYVVTRSEGEDPYRHVVISLKRDGRDRREGRRGQDKNQGQEKNQVRSQDRNHGQNYGQDKGQGDKIQNQGEDRSQGQGDKSQSQDQNQGQE